MERANTEEIYKNLRTASNGSLIAFNAITLDILAGTKVKDSKISLLRNKMSVLLWEWLRCAAEHHTDFLLLICSMENLPDGRSSVKMIIRLRGNYCLFVQILEKMKNHEF